MWLLWLLLLPVFWLAAPATMSPSIPDVTAKNVTVKFVDRKGKEVGTTVVKNVKLTETKMNSNDVQAPEGYVVGIVGDQFIDWDNQTVTFTVDKVDKK